MNEASERLRLLVERAERLIEERRGISDDLRDVFAEAKAVGFDVPTIRWAIKEREKERKNREKRQEEIALQETYGVQLGLF